MSTITTAYLWKDTGFTEGCMEVPSTDLPSPNLMFTALNPTKGRMFSELRVPEDYVTLCDYSYLAINVSNNNGPDRIYYGWIDSVEMISDSVSSPVTQINWHVDLWRTYFSDAEFGSGMVKRRPLSTDQPPQQPSYRYLVPGTPVNFYQNDGIWWVIVALTKDTQTGTDPDITTVTTLEYRLVPISGDTSNYNNGLYITGGHAMPASKIFNGDWDEAWEIDPNRVISVFLSPICPYNYSGTGTSANPISIGVYWTPSGNDGVKYFTNYTTSYPFQRRIFNLNETIMTTDTTQYHVRGFDGETVGILPWGVPVIGGDVRLVYSTTSAYVQVRFKPYGPTIGSYDYTLSHQYGITYNIPCWALDVTDNTWSSYVYSGQRQYDMEQRQLSSESSAVSGGLSVGASALTGAASGAMLGSVVPGVGTLVGGIIGAVGGAVTGAITTGGMYAYETMYKNDQMQRMEDYAHANQADTILLPGNGMDCIEHGCQLSLVPLTMDAYSQTQYTNDMTIYGAKVSEPMADCTSLISAKGPIQIQNLIVKGDIPPMAKDYIKQRFAQGVIIK